MPFFKRDGDALLSGPSVYADSYYLQEESHADHLYPVDGWYWFADLDAALNGMPRAAKTTSVTMRQARLVLLRAGLLNEVDSVIDSLPSPQKEAARIEWEYAGEVQKNSRLVSQLITVLGLTEQQIDDMFELAATL